MPQGRMSEADAMALGKKQRLANDIRLGRKTMGPPLPPKMADSAGATGGPSFSKNPYAKSNDGASSASPASRSSSSSSSSASDTVRSNMFNSPNLARPDTKTPIIQMRQGMSPSSQGYNRANETPVADASKQLRGYGYDLIAHKGKSFEEAKKLMSGTDQYRGLSQHAKDYVMQEFDAWWNNQTAGGKVKRELEAVRRGGQPSMSQAPNRKPDLIKQYKDEAANYGEY
jgi:hypothetical protein